MIDRWGVALPTRADLPAPPRGVVLHWTGGSNRPNYVDLSAYHIVVDGAGGVHLGRWSIAANMRRLSGNAYAHHTGGWNSYRVGISACGMYGYHSCAEPGPYPLTEVQVDRMCEVAAYVVGLGSLDPLHAAHVCTHLEVWTLNRVRGATNHTKLDIECLPYLPGLGRDEVGPYLRKKVAAQVGPSASNAKLPVLRRGAGGPDVRTLQRLLGVQGAPVFGPKTEAAVRQFQHLHGLVMDGVVGPKTWRVLLAHGATPP